MKDDFSILGERRVSRFDPNLAERIEAWDKELTLKEEAERRRMELEARLNPKPAEEAKPSIAPGSAYAVVRMADTYASGAHALRRACEKDPGCIHPTFTRSDGSAVYRPLTFEENIRARLEDYNTLDNPDGGKRGDEERLRLFRTWLDSCTGFAYKNRSTLFKIITMSEDLIGIPENFSGHYIRANYPQLQGVELDSRKGKYNQLPTLDDVINHPAWNEAVTDKPLLNEYANLVFRLRTGNNMGFWVRQNTFENELRALYVGYISGDSVAFGDLSLLDNGGCFVRATHVAPKVP